MSERMRFGRGAIPSWLFMWPWDIGLFLRSARTDAAIERMRAGAGARAAFEAAYARSSDPWASASRRYRYQRNKYAGIVSILPRGMRFGRALDLGCGTGLLSHRLTAIADSVLGLDIAQSAVDLARSTLRPTEVGGTLQFAQADIVDLPESLIGRFDLVVVADTIYYLDDTTDTALARVAHDVARLVAPGGICLIANHYFFAADSDSRKSRRIHDAFRQSTQLSVVSEHRRAFYLATLLSKPALTEAAHIEPASAA